jgi:cytochrome c oxidase subunit II
MAKIGRDHNLFRSEMYLVKDPMKNFALILTILYLGTAPLLSGDAAKGKQLYAVCTACHGVNGEGNIALKSPPVAGQEDWYLKTQLLKFKAGIRGADPKDIEGMQMRSMAMTLADDASMQDVIAYIKTFKGTKPASTLKGGDPVKGKGLYMTCLACHGPKAEGVKALKGPSLKQLPDWYLLAQINKFKSGVRGSHPKDVEGMQMRPMATLLKDEQAMKDVIAYIHSLE